MSFNKWIDGVMVWHQIAGQVLIAVVVLRLLWKFRQPNGGIDPTRAHPAWERSLAKTVQIALYLTVIAMVATGYVAASGETDNALLAPLGSWLSSSESEGMEAAKEATETDLLSSSP